MKHSVPHDLGRDTAKKVAEAALNSYKQKFAEYNPSVDWVSPDRATLSFSVKGLKLNGGLEVNEKDIAMELEVPFLLRPFKKTAINVIEGQIKDWIGKAKAGKL